MNNNTKARWKATSKKERKQWASIPRKSTRPKVGGFSKQTKRTVEEL